MRSFKVIALFSIVIIALVFWFRKAEQRYTNAGTQTQSSQLPARDVAVVKSTPIMVKKAIGDQFPVKAIPFQQRHKLDGPAGNDASPMDLYRGLKMSDAVKLNGRDRIVLGARAVPTAQYNSSFGPVLFQRSGFSIVGLNLGADPQWNDLIMHESDRPVVVNPANGQLGIVTGTLMIKFSDIHQADKLAGRENLQLTSLDEAIGVGYFKAPDNYHLLSASQRLQNEPDVLRVELEVVDSFRGTR